MIGCTDCSDAPEISDDNATATTPEAPNPTDPTVTPPISNPTELEEPTVQNTEDCDDGIWDGDIRYESDLLAASNCVEINGYIELENVTSITEIDFPVLERINGQILLSELPNLMSISMPFLTTVVGADSSPAAVDGSYFAIDINDNALLTGINLSSLVIVEGVNISNNALLREIAMPALTTVDGGDLRIWDNNGLTNVSMPLLTTVRVIFEMDISSNNTLHTIKLPSLTMVGSSFRIKKNAALQSLDLPLLTTVVGSFFMDVGILISDNKTLTKIDMPLLTTVDRDSLRIDNNFVLMNINMPTLDTVSNDQVIIEDVDTVTSCDLGNYNSFCP